jgi:tetratricopeptide (TPR) repeat protein
MVRLLCVFMPSSSYVYVCSSPRPPNRMPYFHTCRFPFPIPTYSHTDEAAASTDFSQIARSAGVDSKLLFLLTTVDLKGSLRKLDGLLFDLALGYYNDQIKRVKKLKDRVSRTHQPGLYVRHHFKIGYFCEMANDHPTALKYYRSAYEFLNRCHDNNRDPLNAAELKSVASLLSFKISSILLSQSDAISALNQSDEHIQRYRNIRGLPELEFAHWAWISEQYETMASLIASSQWMHNVSDSRLNAGYLYQTAAAYCRKRKRTAARVLASAPLLQYRPPLPLYYGQTNIGDTGATDAQIRQQTVAIVMHHEKQVVHSDAIIRLLTSAYSFFKMHAATKSMMLHVVVRIGEQHLESGNVAMAQKFYERVGRTYRKECWWVLLADILVKTLQCAHSLQDNNSIVRCSTALLSPLLGQTVTDRQQLQQRVEQLMCQTPRSTSLAPSSAGASTAGPPTSIHPSDNTAASAVVSPTDAVPELGGATGLGGVIQVDKNAQVLHLQGYFSTQENSGSYATTRETIRFVLRVQSNMPNPMSVAYVAVYFSHAPFNTVICESKAALQLDDHACAQVRFIELGHAIVLKPGEVAEYHFEMAAVEAFGIGGALQCNGATVCWLPGPEELKSTGADAQQVMPVLLQCDINKPSDEKYQASMHPKIVAPESYTEVDLYPNTVEVRKAARQAALDRQSPHPDSADDRKSRDDGGDGDDNDRNATAEKMEPFAGRLDSVFVRSAQPSATIVVEHHGPCLLREAYRVVVTINAGLDEVKHGQLNCSYRPYQPDKKKPHFNSNSRESIPLPLRMYDAGTESLRPANGDDTDSAVLKVDAVLQPGESTSYTLFVTMTQRASGQLAFRFNYRNADGQQAHVYRRIPLPVCAPFEPRYVALTDITPTSAAAAELATRTSRSSRRAAASVELHVDCPFWLHVELRNTSGHELLLHGIEPEVYEEAFRLVSIVDDTTADTAPLPTELKQVVAFGGAPSTDRLLTSPILLKPGERYSHAVLLCPIKFGNHRPVRFHIRWSRNRYAPGLLATVDSLSSSSSSTSTSTSTSSSLPTGKTTVTSELVNGPCARIQLNNHQFSAQDARINMYDVLSALYQVEPTTLGVRIDMPRSVNVSECFSVTIHIKNTTGLIQDILVEVVDEPNNNTSAVAVSSSTAQIPSHLTTMPPRIVVIAGTRVGRVRLLPHDSQSVCYNMVVLKCGEVALPTLRFVSAQTNRPIFSPADIGNVFVRPHSKVPRE